MQSSAVKPDRPSIKISPVRQKNIHLILKAAEDEFVVSGFKGASIRGIANRAGLPKANIHYYFNSKVDLYRAVLRHIMELWEVAFVGLSSEDDPETAFRHYIKSKMHYCLANSNASRIFSSEIINGGDYLKEHFDYFKNWIEQKSNIINQWVKDGKMDPVDPVHLLFTIWATTQYYVNFNPQVACAMGKESLSAEDIDDAAENLCTLIIRGCGIGSCRKQSEPVLLNQAGTERIGV